MKPCYGMYRGRRCVLDALHPPPCRFKACTGAEPMTANEWDAWRLLLEQNGRRMLFNICYGDFECRHDALLEGPDGMTTAEFRGLCEILKPVVVRGLLAARGDDPSERPTIEDLQKEYVRLLLEHGFKKVEPVSFYLPTGRDLDPGPTGGGDTHRRWLGEELVGPVLAHNAKVQKREDEAGEAFLETLEEERKAEAKAAEDAAAQLVEASQAFESRVGAEKAAAQRYAMYRPDLDDIAKLRHELAEAVLHTREAGEAVDDALAVYKQTRKG